MTFSLSPYLFWNISWQELNLGLTSEMGILIKNEQERETIVNKWSFIILQFSYITQQSFLHSVDIPFGDRQLLNNSSISPACWLHLFCLRRLLFQISRISLLRTAKAPLVPQQLKKKLELLQETQFWWLIEMCRSRLCRIVECCIA